MESRQSNKATAIQRGGNEKGSSFVIRDVFSSFSLLINDKEFRVGVSLGYRSPFCSSCSCLYFAATPFPLLFQFTYYRHVAFRDTEGISFLQFIPFFFTPPRVLLHLLQIAFFTTPLFILVVVGFTVPNVMPGSVFIPRLTVGCFHSEVH